MKINFRKIAVLVLAVMLVCSVTVGVVHAAGTDSILTYAGAGRTPMTAAELYAQNVNATVGIRTSSNVNYFGYQTIAASAGSGFIITEDGYILTNYHVVDDASNITVTTYGNDSYTAELVGYDNSNDIAVLKIDADNLTPVTIGDSDALVVGEDVVAIGNPLGELTFSLTRGIVSALDRSVTLSGTGRLKLIQTDCAINSGNSGGPLFNMYGEVIGITNAKYSSSGFGASIDNIAFAIPINTVLDVAEQIMTTGEISKPYLGVTVTDVDESLRAYGVPDGADIYSVEKDSPAEKAGLQKNDVVTAANGTAITGSDDLVKFIRSCEVGDNLSLTVFRQGQTMEIGVTIGESVKDALPSPTPEQPQNAPQDNSRDEYSDSNGSFPFPFFQFQLP